MFAVREFRWLWIAQALSFAGDQFAQVAIAILVFRRTAAAACPGGGLTRFRQALCRQRAPSPMLGRSPTAGATGTRRRCPSQAPIV